MTRKTPIRHSVTSYKKKDGTVVHTFKRGSGHLNPKYARKRALGSSKTGKYLLVDEDDPRNMTLWEGTIEITRYPEDPSHMYKYVSLRMGQGYNNVTIDTLKRVAKDAGMKHFMIKDHETDKVVYITSELERALDEQERQNDVTAKKLQEDREKWMELPRESSMETVGGSSVFIRRGEVPAPRYTRNRHETFSAYAAISHTHTPGGRTLSTNVTKDELYSSTGAIMKKRVLERYKGYFDDNTPEDVIIQTLVRKVKEAEEFRAPFLRG